MRRAGGASCPNGLAWFLDDGDSAGTIPCPLKSETRSSALHCSLRTARDEAFVNSTFWIFMSTWLSTNIVFVQGRLWLTGSKNCKLMSGHARSNARNCNCAATPDTIRTGTVAGTDLRLVREPRFIASKACETLTMFLAFDSDPPPDRLC
ncbi:hypothetical protein JQ622_06340 [Bradyrhizobium diazoefficiens]|nr:hypothetical protein [Bradyrhizobium diazoefficiens]MBR0977813.1 hypothetical protein [Bradyrhizobium diazoefficiens]MBR1056812.1 hypothetical protein [Bradyrhizobium diazoefficiens]